MSALVVTVIIVEKQGFVKQKVYSVADGKSDKKKHILLVVRISVVVVGLALAAIWVFRERMWTDLTGAFGMMDFWVFACVFAVFLVSQLVVVLRWWLLLQTQGVHIGFWAAVRLYFLGWFYNNIMPGSVGGDLIRIWYVTKHTEKKFEAGLSVFVDRIIGLLSTLVIALFFYVIFLRSEELSSEPKEISKYWWVVLLVFGVFLGLLSGFQRGRSLLVKVWGGVLRVWEKLVSAGKLYGRRPLTILAAFGLTVALQIVTITGFWFLGRNIGIEASIKYYYVFFTLVWVVGAIPFSIAGAGVVELALVGLFVEVAGVPEAKAMALALLQRFTWLLASLPGALIHLTGAHLPKDFSIDCEVSGK